MRLWTTLFLLLTGLAFAKENKPASEAVARGKKLFLDNQDWDYPACADCHNTVPEKDEKEKAKYLGPGVTLHGAARRAGWRNLTRFENVAEASDYCAEKWQDRKNGLDAKQKKDLLAYLESIGGDKALPMREVERKPKLLKEIGGGDATKGKKTAIRYCGKCHNPDGLSFDLEPGSKKKDLIARKVRGYNAKRKFKPWKGTMSYYTTDRLSDEDLRDIIAFLGK